MSLVTQFITVNQKCITVSFHHSLLQTKFVNYCLYLLKFEDIFQAGDIFVTATCHDIREFKEVAEVYVLWSILSKA